MKQEKQSKWVDQKVMDKYDAEVASVNNGSSHDVNQTFGYPDDGQSSYNDTESRMTGMHATQMNWVKEDKIEQDDMNKEVNFDQESFRVPDSQTSQSQMNLFKQDTMLDGSRMLGETSQESYVDLLSNLNINENITDSGALPILGKH